MKKAQKVDFRIILDPFWGFTLKTVLGIYDPRISSLLFGTKNHEMRGPPVAGMGRNFEDYPGFQPKTTPTQRHATQ